MRDNLPSSRDRFLLAGKKNSAKMLTNCLSLSVDERETLEPLRAKAGNSQGGFATTQGSSPRTSPGAHKEHWTTQESREPSLMVRTSLLETGGETVSVNHKASPQSK